MNITMKRRYSLFHSATATATRASLPATLIAAYKSTTGAASDTTINLWQW